MEWIAWDDEAAEMGDSPIQICLAFPPFLEDEAGFDTYWSLRPTLEEKIKSSDERVLR